MSMNKKQEYDLAVFTEVAKEKKEMQPGWNVRVFNEIEILKGSSISKKDDGTITLAPGLYHISALSLLCYMIDGVPGKSVESDDFEASAGYCAICTEETGRDGMLAIGSMMDYKDNTASFIDNILEFDETTSFQMKHQVGGNPENVFLQGNGQRSTHVYARITIRRLKSLGE